MEAGRCQQKACKKTFNLSWSEKDNRCSEGRARPGRGEHYGMVRTRADVSGCSQRSRRLRGMSRAYGIMVQVESDE